jgi:hypothetical protein
VRLPAAASSAIQSRAQIAPVRFELEDNVWRCRTRFLVERDGSAALALLGPAATEWRVKGAPRGSEPVDLDEHFPSSRRAGIAGEELQGWSVVRRDWRNLPGGEWELWVEAPQRSSAAPGWLIGSGLSDVRAEAYWSSARWVRGSGVAVLARARGAELGAIVQARVFVDVAGAVQEFPMHDDGAHNDGEAQDGLFGWELPAELAGRISARVELSMLSRAGQPLIRSAVLSCTLVEPALSLSESIDAQQRDGTTWTLAIEAWPLDTPRRLQVSAELWSKRGQEWVPVCWLARMQWPRVDGPRWVLDLDFDTRWLDLAQAGVEFELRELRVQDPDTQALLDHRAQMPWQAPALAMRRPQALAGLSTSSLLAALGMPTGPHTPATPQLLQPALMLVHGYCSSASIWPAAHFTQPKLEFLDPNANRTHDAFAQLIAARAQTAQLSSFGVVGHSQGGPAALHLLTYYSSGLDFASGPRRIQSVASPYQGTPLASLGFFACGVNDNMTPAGSATWLAGIPSWARAEVSYWTTSNSGSACNFLTGLLLADPEDGTVEKARGELVGGVSMGHSLGWCHTTGMSNPANYTDATRNQAMNAAAAR